MWCATVTTILTDEKKVLKSPLQKKSFLLIATLVWVWFTTSLLVDNNYDFLKPQPHTEQVSDVRIANQPR